MEKVKDVLRAASRFSAGTLLSRCSGLLRDVGIAYAFGGGAQIAGFMVAFRLANLLRRLLGEGILQTGFVPIYESLKKQDSKQGALLYRDMLWSIAILALSLSIGCIFAARSLKGFLDPSWSEILGLTEIMVPSLLWVSLFGLDAALLQAEKKSFWAGFAPTLFNFGMFAFTFVAAESDAPMELLSVGVVCSFALQWSVAAVQAKRSLSGLLSLREWISPLLFSSEVKRALSAIGLGVIGIGAMQLNSALDAVFARIADPSGPAFLWYAIRLYQLPIALIGVALSSALLPSLVRKNLDNTGEGRLLLEGVLEKGMGLIFVCGFALVAFAQPGVNFLFGHGQFSASEVTQTVRCLWAYAAGFVPAALVLLLAQGHYARRSFAGPVVASMLSIGAHLCLNVILVFGFHLGAVSVALSTSFGAMLNCYLLWKGQGIQMKWPLGPFSVTLVGAVLCLVSDQMFGSPRDLWMQVAHLSANGTLFGGMVGAYWIKNWRPVEESPDT